MQRENENVVWVDVSHYVVLGSITKELSELFVKNTEFSALTKTFLNQDHCGACSLYV